MQGICPRKFSFLEKRRKRHTRFWKSPCLTGRTNCTLAPCSLPCLWCGGASSARALSPAAPEGLGQAGGKSFAESEGPQVRPPSVLGVKAARSHEDAGGNALNRYREGLKTRQLSQHTSQQGGLHRGGGGGEQGLIRSPGGAPRPPLTTADLGELQGDREAAPSDHLADLFPVVPMQGMVYL